MAAIVEFWKWLVKFTYTSSKGFLLSSRICLKWLGVSPVTFLNWLLK